MKRHFHWPTFILHDVLGVRGCCSYSSDKAFTLASLHIDDHKTTTNHLPPIFPPQHLLYFPTILPSPCSFSGVIAASSLCTELFAFLCSRLKSHNVRILTFQLKPIRSSISVPSIPRDTCGLFIFLAKSLSLCFERRDGRIHKAEHQLPIWIIDAFNVPPTSKRHVSYNHQWNLMTIIMIHRS